MQQNRNIPHRNVDGRLLQVQKKPTKTIGRSSSSGEVAVLKAHIQKNITVFQRLRDK